MRSRDAGHHAEGYRRFQLKVGGDPDVDIARIFAVAAKLQLGEPAYFVRSSLQAGSETGASIRLLESGAASECPDGAGVKMKVEKLLDSR